MRISKGSQEVNKLNVERLIKSVQNPIVRMDLRPHAKGCLWLSGSQTLQRATPVSARPLGLEVTLASPHPSPMAWGVPPKFFSHFLRKAVNE